MIDEHGYTIWAVAEHSEGRVQPVTYEVLAFASRVVQAIGGRIAVLVLGSHVKPIAEEIARETDCDVVGLESPGALTYNAETFRSLLTNFYKFATPQCIFIPHTSTGLDFAPSLAVDLGASCLTGVSDFKCHQGIIFTRQLCNGKMVEDLRPLPGRPAVVTVTPGAENVLSPGSKGSGVFKLYQMETPAGRTKPVRYIEPPPSTVDLRNAEVIVAGGRGIGAPEHLGMIQELAALFKRGAVGASRPLCDMGWLPFECQIGMTGQTVSPKLYIACGISGALQHTMGMKRSGLIVVVNTDTNVPFCSLAHYCVIADLHTFVPIFIERIRSFSRRSLYNKFE